MKNAFVYSLFYVALACIRTPGVENPVSLVTDFSTNTKPFDYSAQFVTSQYYSAPGCMGVAAQAVLAKTDGWPYQVSGLFYAGENYPTFPMSFRFMMKAGNYVSGTQPFSIDIVARRHPGDPTWLGAYVGRCSLVKTATTSDWFVGIDTVISDFGATVDQLGKTFRELYSGPVILYFVVVPGDRKVYVDDIHIADASAATGVSNRLSVVSKAPVTNSEMKMFAPNGRAFRCAERLSAMNYMVTISGRDVRGHVMER